MRGTGFDKRLWQETEADPSEQPGVFCVLCLTNFETKADWDAHSDACLDAASEPK
jgi:hypothetical protein